jgi:catechol 2,3-dioxygenase-like lactoylglutathione lyase family enzyme
MIKSRGLNHINLNVSDIRRSLRFYQEAFGLEIKFWEGQRMVFLGSPGVHDIITLCEVDKSEPVGSGGVSHFGFALTETRADPPPGPHLLKADDPRPFTLGLEPEPHSASGRGT